jgi:hypothetical protein
MGRDRGCWRPSYREVALNSKRWMFSSALLLMALGVCKQQETQHQQPASASVKAETAPDDVSTAVVGTQPQYPPEVLAAADEINARVTSAEYAAAESALDDKSRAEISSVCKSYPEGTFDYQYCTKRQIEYFAKWRRPRPPAISNVTYTKIINDCSEMFPDIEMREYCRGATLFGELRRMQLPRKTPS